MQNIISKLFIHILSCEIFHRRGGGGGRGGGGNGVVKRVHENIPSQNYLYKI